MVRGERDYTQRVLATIRPSGILGGRLVFMEDFESLVIHSYNPSVGFSRTTTQGTVWQGEASGQFIIPAATSYYYPLDFPLPAVPKLSVEVIWKPVYLNLEHALVEFQLYDGEYAYGPYLTLDNSSGVLKLGLWNSSLALTTVKTFSTTDIRPYWHVLYMLIDIPSHKYEIVQFDNIRIVNPGVLFPKVASTMSPMAWVFPEFRTKAGLTETVYFDNLIVGYEED